MAPYSSVYIYFEHTTQAGRMRRKQAGAGAHEHGVHVGVRGLELLGAVSKVPLLTVKERAQLIHVSKHHPAVMRAGQLHAWMICCAHARLLGSLTMVKGVRKEIYCLCTAVTNNWRTNMQGN